jgi:hypothetical protein
MHVVGYKKAKVYGGGSNWDKQAIELNLKNFKVWLDKVKVVVCANKVAHP